MKNKYLVWVRIGIQAAALFIAPSLFSEAFHAVKETVAAVGGQNPLEWTGFTTKFFALSLATVLFGRIFCGWLCVFGALGDWIYYVGNRIRKRFGMKEVSLPDHLIPILQKLKYFVLLLILAFVFCGRDSTVSRYSPWDFFARLVSGNFRVVDMGISGLVFFVLAAGMFCTERFFCQFLCPLGAIFSLLPLNPLLQWDSDKSGCIENCRRCRKKCPMNLKPGEDAYQDAECIRCGKCTGICPKGNCHMAGWKLLQQKKHKKSINESVK